MATVNPAKVVNRAPKLGTLQVGAPADVSLLEVVEGPVEFVDTRNNKRNGKVYLKPAQTVVGGVAFLAAFWLFRQAFARRTGGVGFRR